MNTVKWNLAGVPKMDRLLTTSDAEQALGVHAGFLNKDRICKARIPFVKIGRSVRYRRSDVETFIASNLRKSTSDIGGAQ